MSDHSSTQSFSSHHHQHHHHHQLPSCHLTLHNLQGPELGYPPSQPAPEPLEEHGSRDEDSATPFLISNPSPGGRRVRGGGDRGLLNTSSGSLNGDANAGGHLDGELGASSHFPHTYDFYTSKREDIWEDGESFDSAAECFYSKGNSCVKENEVFHIMNPNIEEIRQNFRADKSEANMSQQTAPFTRSASDGQEHCRTNSTMSDNYAGRDEDYGSSCGSGEDHLQPAEIEGPWFSASPSRGPADTHTGDPAQHSPVSIGSGTYPQKLDSFSDAFLSQRKGRFPIIPQDDSGGQIWEFGKGGSPRLDSSRQSCAFDPDPYLPPASASSPFHSSFASFPSPSTSSPLVSAVLSPPPTPRPPPSFSPAAFGGSGHSTSHGGDSLGALQFFASYSQSLPSVQTSGMIWKLPLMAHNFSPSSALKVDCERDFNNFSVANFSDAKGGLRSSRSDITASQKHKSPESFLASGLPPSVLRPSTIACLPPSYHLPSLPSQQNEMAERVDLFLVTQKKPSDVINPAQHQISQIYTGTPFPSILHSGRGQRKGHYTPRPLLNPARKGKGLSFNLSPQHHAADGGGDGGVSPYVNIGHEFQAELPPYALTRDGTARWPTDEESPREQLLWKPWPDLEDSANLQDQVEKLLSVCSSSCLPGGGSNTELALHCLHYCQGDTMATMEMLLFSHPSPAGDYHYSGSDFWTDAEKSLFNAALGTYGKEFSLIRKTVRTKTVQQCVEFFYLNKKLHDKQEKQKQENQDGGLEQQTGTTPNCKSMNRPLVLEEVVPVHSLAGFFPCKLCGKMFYKIKSRNAHMKIHRQPPDDWADRRLQHQLVTQRSGGNLHPTQVPFRSIPSSCLPGRTRNADIVLNLLTEGNAPSNTSVLDPSAMVTCSNNVASSSHVSTDTTQREHASRVPFYQSWGSFGPESGAFYCNTEGKDDVGAGGAKEPIKWQ